MTTALLVRSPSKTAQRARMDLASSYPILSFKKKGSNERKAAKEEKQERYRSRIKKAMLCVRGKMTDIKVYDNSIMERKRRGKTCSEKACKRAYSPSQTR